ncbi:MAG: TrkH family potassium uptake protein [Planctomycetota bacterium]|nr:TrkH family potassium uptake protein [Planctomycetota bacterium]
MNFRLLSRQLGIISLLIGGTMLFSLPWAFPSWGKRKAISSEVFEQDGAVALGLSIAICAMAGFLLILYGRNARGRLYRREAMAVVGLSWVLATVLGALPYKFAGCMHTPRIRLDATTQTAQLHYFNGLGLSNWSNLDKPLDRPTYRVLQEIVQAGYDGLSELKLRGALSPELASQEVDQALEQLRTRCQTYERWGQTLAIPEQGEDTWKVHWVTVGIADCLFESQSGFSTTGATIFSDLENVELIPHCILFWRSSTHLLGGLGIVVLFVVILGQGSAGKALMRAEMPGPTKEGSQARMQDTAWLFAGIYLALNVLLSIILKILGMTWFSAICHAFGTMATGGFSTYNLSVGHYQSAAIDYVITLFMILAGTNFTLLYFLLLRQPGKLLADIEWRTYMGIIGVVTLLVILFGISTGDFPGFSDGLRYGLFQVVAIITTTGYGTHDFDQWNHFGRGILFALMFVGGCAGSTGGGMKVIRHILFFKILRLEMEQAYHPTVVRPLRLGGTPVDDRVLRSTILVYFGLILAIFVLSWLFVIAIEPDTTWGPNTQHKLIDSASSVAATLNNIGPGLGTVGATRNYGHFSWINKLLFVWLMMLGRLELFSILVLSTPSFWKFR